MYRLCSYTALLVSDTIKFSEYHNYYHDDKNIVNYSFVVMFLIYSCKNKTCELKQTITLTLLALHIRVKSVLTTLFVPS